VPPPAVPGQAVPPPTAPAPTPASAVSERVVIGPQARGAASGPKKNGYNGNGHNGNGHNGNGHSASPPPRPNGPPKRVVITLERGDVLPNVLDIVESHAGSGPDAVVIRVPSDVGLVELENPSMRLHYGIQVTHALRRYEVRVEEVAWAS
jgi:hypothetical protein